MFSKKISGGVFGRQELRRDLRIALLSICLVGILAIGAVLQIYRIGETTDAYMAVVERSTDQRKFLRQLQVLLIEAEQSVSEFLATGNRNRLAAFSDSERAIGALLDALPSRAGTHSTEQSHSRAVGEIVRERLNQLSLEAGAYDAGYDVGRFSRNRSAALNAFKDVHELVNVVLAIETSEIEAASQRLSGGLGQSRLITVLLMCTILVLVTGAAVTVLAYLSHRNRVEQQLVEAREMAEAANVAKSDFLASMSHEIRTPLTSIIGYSDLLLEGQLSPSQRHYLDRLRTSGGALLGLVNDILDFSKIEAGELVIQSEPVCLGALIDNVLSIVSVDTKRKEIDLVRQVDPALPDVVLADDVRLRQVLLNLLNNAVKFTASGSITLTVRAVSGERPDVIRFEIRDTGIGIPPEKQADLFQKFSQLDGSIQREYGGTGLGLAISRQIVRLMEGDIGVESDLGKGSLFWVELSLPPVETRTGIETEPLTAAGAPLLGGRILLAEDSPHNQELVKAILLRAGYQVDLAADGLEALRAVEAGEYDLVLMDMQMPRMDGLEATRRIRRMPGRQSIPIIALTANVLREHLQMFREAGTNDHVSKPFRKANLLTTIERWIKVAEAEAVGGEHPRQSTHDAAVLKEVRALMGEAWLRASLARLRDNIAVLIEITPDERDDRNELLRRAHQIVAETGQLGFSQLSVFACELEQACARDIDFSGARERARIAAIRAERVISELLTSPNARPVGTQPDDPLPQSGRSTLFPEATILVRSVAQSTNEKRIQVGAHPALAG